MMRAALCLKLLVAASLSTAPAVVDPQASVTEPAHYVTVDDAVRDMLAAKWDTTDVDQHETGYCLAWVPDLAWGRRAYRVWAAAPARTIDAGPAHVLSLCPHGQSIAFLHTHPATSCDDDGHCAWGGPDAWECFPSDQDQRMLDRSGDPFGLIQCDRHALIPFFPTPRHPGR